MASKPTDENYAPIKPPLSRARLDLNGTALSLMHKIEKSKKFQKILRIGGLEKQWNKEGTRFPPVNT
jgi:hypothetical protein